MEVEKVYIHTESTKTRRATSNAAEIKVLCFSSEQVDAIEERLKRLRRRRRRLLRNR